MIHKPESNKSNYNNKTFIELFYSGLNLRKNWIHIKHIKSD